MKPSLHHSLFKTLSVVRRCIAFRAANVVRVGQLPLLILEQLRQRDGRSEDNLSAACELNQAQLHSARDKLLRENLVECRDGLLFLTDEGKLTADWLDYLIDGTEELFAADISEEEKQRLMDLLSRVYQNLRGEPIYPQKNEQ